MHRDSLGSIFLMDLIFMITLVCFRMSKFEVISYVSNKRDVTIIGRKRQFKAFVATVGVIAAPLTVSVLGWQL